jgi:hypothetical protein
MSDKITAALRASSVPNKENEEALDESEASATEEVPRIVTTEEELEGFFIVRHILGDIIDKKRIDHRDTESYFGIVLDGNRNKWICRLHLDRAKKRVTLPTEDKGRITYDIDKVDDLYKYSAELRVAASRLLD